ncbi:hypothetical protein HY989_02860 [Candidatus Micrarchaeota archaeon]|nr:hypothetical protein [Candidatus Micrarchaeota archaeon]
MKSKITAKVEGGKMLRMEVELSESQEKAKYVKITGDFFIHPEDSLVVIEKTLVMSNASEGMETIALKIEEICKSQGIQMIGITPQAIASTFFEAIKQAKETNGALE